MKNIYKVTKKHLNNDFYYFDENTTNFGQKAFWLSKPLNTLKNEDYDLRVFMNKLTEYSRKNGFCKQLRKTDKTRLEYLKEYPSNFKRINLGEKINYEKTRKLIRNYRINGKCGL